MIRGTCALRANGGDETKQVKSTFLFQIATMNLSAWSEWPDRREEEEAHQTYSAVSVTQYQNSARYRMQILNSAPRSTTTILKSSKPKTCLRRGPTNSKIREQRKSSDSASPHPYPPGQAARALVSSSVACLVLRQDNTTGSATFVRKSESRKRAPAIALGRNESSSIRVARTVHLLYPQARTREDTGMSNRRPAVEVLYYHSLLQLCTSCNLQAARAANLQLQLL